VKLGGGKSISDPNKGGGDAGGAGISGTADQRPSFKDHHNAQGGLTSTTTKGADNW